MLDYPTLAEKIRALDEIVSILREAGASMDQPNLAGQTPAQLQEQKRARWERGGEYLTEIAILAWLGSCVVYR